MPGSIVNEYMEGSVLSGASAVTATNTKILPEISRENSKNQKRIISNRKASPEAIALLMAGVPSKNKPQQAWVPGGVAIIKREPSLAK
jgi:hypothetical protein